MSSIAVACINAVPTADIIRDDGWQALASVTALACAQYTPISTTVLGFDGMFAVENQSAWLRQVRVRVTYTGTSAAASKALIIYWYTNGSPTAPVIGTVYNEASTNQIGITRVPAANFERSRTLEVTAVVNPNRIIKSGTTEPTTIYGVVLSDDATFDYDASPTVEVFMETELCT